MFVFIKIYEISSELAQRLQIFVCHQKLSPGNNQGFFSTGGFLFDKKPISTNGD